MAEKLDIKISSADALKQIRALNTGLKALNQTINSFGAGVQNITRVTQALANLKPVNPAVAQSLKTLNQETAALAASGKINETTLALQQMSKVQLSNAANGVKQITSAANSLGASKGLSNFGAQSRKLASDLDRSKAAALTSKAALASISAYAVRAGTSVRALGGAYAQTTSNALRFTSSVRQAKASLSEMVSKAGALTSALGNLRGKFEVQAALDFGRAIFEAGTQFQQFELAMRTVSEVGTTMQNIKSDIVELANSTATSVTALTTNFQQFSIAAKQSGMKIAESREIFKSFSTALRVTGASTVGTKLAFLSLTQMVSKGTVQSEELRRQLAEQMPGAFAIFAEAAGVSTAQLGEMMKRGEVLSKDILPKVAKILNEKFGPSLAAAMQTPIAKLTLLQNKITLLYDAIARGSDGQGGAFSGLVSSLTELDRIAGSPLITGLATMLGAIASVTFEALALGLRGVANVLDAISGPLVVAWEGIKGIGGAFADALSPITSFLASVNTLGGTLDSGIISLRTLGAGLTVLATGFVALQTVMAAKVMWGWGVAIAKGAALASSGLALTTTATFATSLGFKAATLSARVFTIALAATGIGLAIVAIGVLTAAWMSSSEATEKAAKATQITAGMLTANNESLKKAGEEYKKMASSAGLSASETDKFTDMMIRSTATAEQNAAALLKSAESYTAQADKAREGIANLDNYIKKLDQLRETNGGLTASQTKVYNNLVEGRGVLQESANKLDVAAIAAGGAAASFEKINEIVLKAQEPILTWNETFSKLGQSFTDFLPTADQVSQFFSGDWTFATQEGLQTVSDKAVTAKGSLDNLGNADVSGLESGLSGIGTTLSNIVQSAKDTVSALLSVGQASDSAGLSSSRRSGGYATGGGETVSTRPGTFSGNIPHLSQGTTNTNTLGGRSSGGIPTILHPNEAVIPLSKGREIPVNIKTPTQSRSADQSAKEKKNLIGNAKRAEDSMNKINNTPSKQDIKVIIKIQALDVDSFKQSQNQILRDFAVKMGEAIQQYG